VIVLLNRFGFTIVELLIVLTVISLLLLSITPLAVNAVRKAKMVNIVLMMRNIAEALEDYFYSDGSRMSEASEVDLSWITVDYLHEHEYLRPTIKDVVIEWKDKNLNDGSAIARVEYKGDFNLNKLKQFWKEINDDDEDGKADILRKLIKYW